VTAPDLAAYVVTFLLGWVLALAWSTARQRPASICRLRGFHVAAFESFPGSWDCACGQGLCYCPGAGTRWRDENGLGVIVKGVGP